MAVMGTEERPSAFCINSTGGKVYCACSGGNDVAVIDGLTNTISAVVPVGSQPKALLHDPIGNKVYCADFGVYGLPASLTVIDGDGDSVLRTIETGPQGGPYPQVLCLNMAGDRLYEALYEDNTVLVVDAVADTIVCRVPLEGNPYALCYGPVYNYLYVSTYGVVDVIDGNLNVMIARVGVGIGPVALCYVPVGAKVYTANSYSGTVSVIAGERPEHVAEIEVGSQPFALCWNSADNRVYCANQADSTVAVIDASADTVITRLQVGDSPCALTYDSLNNYVYCACRGSNEVAVIDGRRDSVVTTVDVGAEPTALVWNPVGLRTYVANYSGSSVSVIRDSIHVGVAEGGVLPRRRVTPTLVRGTLPLAGNSRAVLLDITGRKAAELLPGANDIRHLAPGVYFVVTPSPFSSPPEGERVGVRRRSASVAKVVVTR
jgi:YVTN family beta-propeller protein